MRAKATWMIALATLAVPVAIAQTAPSKAAPAGEEAKISQPAETSTRGQPAAKKSVPVSAEQQKINERTGNETRETGTYKKKSPQEKAAAKADKKAKRTGVSKEEQEKQLKASPGN